MLLSICRIIAVALLWVTLTGCTPRKTIRVVSWNMEWFPGGRPDAPKAEQERQMKAAKATLRKLDPDVLLLQEVRDDSAVRELCGAVSGLDLHVISAFKGMPQNLAIASRYPADSAWHARWKAGAVEPPRGYAFAALQLPNGKFLLTYSLHLKSNLGDFNANIAQRQESIRQLLPHVQEMMQIYTARKPVGVVIGGDFNTSLDDDRFKAEQTLPAMRNAGFHWTHFNVPFAQRVTLPAEGQYPDATFDHIFTAGLGEPRSSVHRGQKVSDHNPVIIEIDPKYCDFQPELATVDLKSGPTKPLFPAPTDTLTAGAREELRKAAGHQATVHGQVSTVGATRSESIHFINFQGNRRGDFVAIVRKAAYPTVISGLGLTDLKALQGRTIQVRGEVTIFNDAPQIEVNRADQILVQP